MNDHSAIPASAQDLVDRYSSLGVPHFQRGLVWNDDATSLLLESLYTGTPCGNIILWQPEQPRQHGQPLAEDGLCEQLIVDGQQRIRMLHQVICGVEAGKWYLDLMVDTAFDGLLRGEQRQRLFVSLSRPPPDGNPRYKYNLVSLKDLWLETTELADLFKQHVRCAPGKEEPTVYGALLEVRQRVREMRQHRVFSVISLREESGRYRIDEVVSLYNRINSAGRRVEAEEMAYATLVRLYSGTTECLRAFFAEVHGNDNADRDTMLKRERERNFGFKLYLRTFVQVCNYHFARSCGTQGFSFDVIDSDELLRWFGKHNAEAWKLFERTTNVLKCVHRIVKDVLKCDDLRMLPDTECLIPVLQLLIRYYPRMLDKRHDQTIAYLILRRLLEPDRTQKQTLALLKTIDNSHRANACMEALAKKDGVEWSEHNTANLKKKLSDANTINDRYVLILYWLVRRNEATDFSYEQLSDEQRKKLELPTTELLVAKDATPQKQHICPSSVLGRSIFDSAGRVKSSRHPVNNIGNLTYISETLNGLTGLSDKWMDIRKENVGNLARHFLAGDVLSGYDELRQRSLNGTLLSGEGGEELFFRFCAARQVLIHKALIDWITALAEAFKTCESDIEPEERLAKPQTTDFIRMLDYPNLIEDALLGLSIASANVKRLEPSERGSWKGKVAILVRERGRSAGFRVEAFSEPRRIEIEEREGHHLFIVLRDIMVRSGIARNPASARPWILRCEMENEHNTGSILAEFVSQLTGGAKCSG